MLKNKFVLWLEMLKEDILKESPDTDYEIGIKVGKTAMIEKILEWLS